MLHNDVEVPLSLIKTDANGLLNYYDFVSFTVAANDTVTLIHDAEIIP